MKDLKKAAAVVLTAVMAANLAGCAMGGKLSPKKLISSAKKYGCEEIKDADDFAAMIEDGEDLEDGAYITVSGNDSKDIFKSNDVLPKATMPRIIMKKWSKALKISKIPVMMSNSMMVKRRVFPILWSLQT